MLTISLFLLIWGTFASGSQILFTASPSTVSVGITKTLELKCSLVDTSGNTNSSPLVGRRDEQLAHSGNVEINHSARDVTLQQSDATFNSHAINYTEFNSEHVISVILTHLNTNKEFASVTSFSGPTGNTDVNKMQVQGHVLSHPGERACLQVTWPRPTFEQNGGYACEINAVDPLGRSVTFTASLQTSMKEPTIPDLVTSLWELEDKDMKHEGNILALQNLIFTHENNISALAATNEKLQSENKQLTNEVFKMASEISSLKLQITKMSSDISSIGAPHTEEGYGYCSTLDTWTNVSFTVNTGVNVVISGNGIESVQNVKFTHAYTSPPAVMIAPASISMPTSTYNVDVVNVTTQGFAVRCSTWFPSMQSGHLNFKWMSSEKTV